MLITVMLFMILLLPSFVVGSVVDCPPNASVVDFTSSFSGERRVFCQINQDGQLQKHGEEKVFSKEGELLSTKYYQNGKEVDKKKQQTAKNGQFSKYEKVFAQLITSVLPVIQQNQKDKLFSTHKCKTDRAKLTKLFLFKKGYTQKYSFRKYCDIEGTANLKLGKEFLADLKLRNLFEFKKTELNLTINLTQEKGLLLVTILCSAGKLFSPKDIIEFSGDYSVLMNPASRQLVKENKGGNFVLTKINGEAMSYKSKIMIQ